MRFAGLRGKAQALEILAPGTEYSGEKLHVLVMACVNVGKELQDFEANASSRFKTRNELALGEMAKRLQSSVASVDNCYSRKLWADMADILDTMKFSEQDPKPLIAQSNDIQRFLEISKIERHANIGPKDFQKDPKGTGRGGKVCTAPWREHHF